MERILQLGEQSVDLGHGDCMDILKSMPPDSVDSVVTDPPYHLSSIVKRFGADGAAPAMSDGATGVYKRASSGFMGKKWDGGDIAFDPALWFEVLRVLKPGGHLVAFGATKGYHRMACAIEDAGFEIRDSLMWLYGTGFPKSHDVSKGIDKAAGAERPVLGKYYRGLAMHPGNEGEDNWRDKYTGEVNITAPATPEAAKWEGWGSALKPAWESICLARKPLTFGAEWVTIAALIDDLEARLWSMLSAKTAEKNFGLSRSEFDAACASAQWSADERNSTQAALSEAMGTSQFESALTSSLNTVSSWRRILGELWQQPSTSTIATELSTTTDWKILKSCLSEITPASIIQDLSPAAELNVPASSAGKYFSASVALLGATLEHHAAASAIEPLVQRSQDGGVRFSPAIEPIVLARKPLSEKTIAANVLYHGTGALNIGACRVGDEVLPAIRAGQAKLGTFERYDMVTPERTGRWPANVIHDGSPEVVEAFPVTTSGIKRGGNYNRENGVHDGGQRTDGTSCFGDSGSAARFFYSAKASKADRAGSKHPTVKPVKLMQWLVTLITPPGGVVLDPFAGTGTTGHAAVLAGMSAVLIEKEDESIVDIRRRIAFAGMGPDEQKRELAKIKAERVDSDEPPCHIEDSEQIALFGSSIL